MRSYATPQKTGLLYLVYYLKKKSEVKGRKVRRAGREEKGGMG